MNILDDIITYVRRIIKTPSNTQISDNLIIDYINRFWLMDVDARMQLVDFKTHYQFMTTPGIDQYNMPLYDTQTSPLGDITPFPMYQGFMAPARAQGINIGFYTDRDSFFDTWPNYTQIQVQADIGDGGSTYDFNLPFFPALPGHIDISGIIASGANTDPIFGSDLDVDLPPTSIHPSVYFTALDNQGRNILVSDSGQFLSDNTSGVLFGILMDATNYPKAYSALTGDPDLTTNTVNYATGAVNVTFPTAVPTGAIINAHSYFIQPGLPRAALFHNNTITLRNPPDSQYQIELDAYLTPAAFLAGSNAIPFAYMAEYVSRGAARKILADTGDVEQFQFYEPLFKEQEMLVWKRSQRISTATRTQTIYSQNGFQSNYNQSSLGV